MDLTKNIIALQKGFVIAPNNENNNFVEVATVQSHLMQYGYMLDEGAFNMLKKSSISFIKTFNDEIIYFLKEALGGLQNFKPLYKNFPEEVMSKSDCELFLNAIFHYWSDGTWEPSTVTFEKPIQFENITYRIISLGDEDRFNKIFTDLVSMNTSLRPQDMSIIEWFVTNNRENIIFPETIPFKETLCTVASFGLDGLPVKTTTDVLRICVSLSGGDISLPKIPKKLVSRRMNRRVVQVVNSERDNFKFKKFSRKERRYILGLLENTNCDPKEMVLKVQRWIRLGEILHPGEFKKKYPKSYEAFQTIRNTKVKSWYGMLVTEMNISFEGGLEFLSKKPGEFSRRLDSLLRNNVDKTDLILKYFKLAATNTSNKVLFELLKHFESRTETKKNRTIMIKGSRKLTTLPTLEPLSEELVNEVKNILYSVLETKFGLLSPLGKCYVDVELKKIPLPTNLRNVDFSTKPFIRGQRIKFDNEHTKVIRPFVHWMDLSGSEDLDLSATFVGDEKVEVLAFTGLYVGTSVHSGDVRHREGPCAEYVDIDIENALERGFKYVSIDVRNFNGRPLHSVNATFGLMERDYPNSNDIWLPETLSSARQLQSPSPNTIACILDLQTKEYIMVDVDSGGAVYGEGDRKTTLKIVNNYINEPTFSVYDLIMMHVNSRGEITEDREDADTRFDLNQFADSYEETGKYMGI